MVSKEQSKVAGVAARFWFRNGHSLKILRRHNNLAEDLAAFDHAQAFNSVLEREHLIDDGFHCALLDKVHQGLQVVVVEAVGADDLQLEAPHVSQIFFRIVTSCRPADQDFTAPLDASE